MKVDFTKIKLVDIEGKELPGATYHKTIANILYQNTELLDLVEVAMKINKGEEVEISKEQLLEIKRLVNLKQSGVFSFARKTTNDFIDSLLEKSSTE